VNDISHTQSSQISPFGTSGKERILRGPAVRMRIQPIPWKATFWRWVKDGVLPPPFTFAGRPAWRESTIEQFIATLGLALLAKPAD